MLKRLLNDENGVAMTEYIIILALVAIASIVVVSVFGGKIRTMFNKANDAMDTVVDTLNAHTP